MVGGILKLGEIDHFFRCWDMSCEGCEDCRWGEGLAWAETVLELPMAGSW